MKTCADCEGFYCCKSKRYYQHKGEICFWFVDRHIKTIPDSNFIADIRKVLFSDDFPEYVVDKLQEMFKVREGESNE